MNGVQPRIWPQDLESICIDEEKKGEMEQFFQSHNDANTFLEDYKREVKKPSLLIKNKEIFVRTNILLGEGRSTKAYKIYNLTLGVMCAGKNIDDKDYHLLQQIKLQNEIEGVYQVYQFFKIQDVWLSVDRLYLSLDQMYREDSLISHIRKVSWIKNLINGLNYLHKQSMGVKPFSHCDIKPENVFLDERGGAVLGDFNCSMTLGGTPAYYSKEKMEWNLIDNGFLGKANNVNLDNFLVEYSQGSDVWALGLTMAYILRGPFIGVKNALPLLYLGKYLKWAKLSPNKEDEVNYFMHACSKIEQNEINEDISALQRNLQDPEEIKISKLLERALSIDTHQRLSAFDLKARLIDS